MIFLSVCFDLRKNNCYGRKKQYILLMISMLIELLFASLWFTII